MELQEPVFIPFRSGRAHPEQEVLVLLQLLPVPAGSAAVLDATEQQQAARFVRDEHRERFILRRSTLRRLLSDWTGINPDAIQYTKGLYGKPELPEVPFHFNLSHTHGAVVYYFGPYAAGIDIEDIQPARRFAEIERTQLHPEEQQCCDSDRDFFTLWTRKEAVLKADGSGLTGGLEQINTAASPVVYRDTAYRVASWKAGNKIISLAVPAEAPLHLQPRFLLL